jgi:hypothetical protein
MKHCSTSLKAFGHAYERCLQQGLKVRWCMIGGLYIVATEAVFNEIKSKYE